MTDKPSPNSEITTLTLDRDGEAVAIGLSMGEQLVNMVGNGDIENEDFGTVVSIIMAAAIKFIAQYSTAGLDERQVAELLTRNALSLASGMSAAVIDREGGKRDKPN